MKVRTKRLYQARGLAELRILLRQAFQKSREDRLSDLAASLAYSSVLSLVPMLAFSYFCLDLLGGIEKLRAELEGFVVPNLAPALGQQVLDYVDSIRVHVSPEAMGAFGVLGFFLIGFSMLGKIEGSLNLVWGLADKRAWWRRARNYSLILVLGPVLMSTSVFMTGQAAYWLRQDHGEISRMILFLFAFLPHVATSLLIWFLYVVLPARKVSRRSAAWAAGFAGLVFEAAKQSYAFYAARALGHSIYGSLTALPIFLVWLDVGWLIILFGAELSYFLELGHNRSDKIV